MNIREYVEGVCLGAKRASAEIALADTALKNKVIALFAEELKKNCANIIAENELDVQAARENGTSEAMCDRLTLTEA